MLMILNVLKKNKEILNRQEIDTKRPILLFTKMNIDGENIKKQKFK